MILARTQPQEQLRNRRYVESMSVGDTTCNHSQAHFAGKPIVANLDRQAEEKSEAHGRPVTVPAMPVVSQSAVRQRITV